MPKTSKIVTATQLKNVGLKTIAVGGVSGLYFRNRPYQSYFFLRFQDKTGRHDLTLGTYPEMSLAKAREEASRLRARISAGENVIASRKQVLVPKQQTVPVLTFEQVAKQWLSERSRLNFWGDNVKGEKRAVRIHEIHAYPFIGNKDINQVSADDVFNLLSKIWLERNATAL